jgi:hypothetical protein
MSSVKVVVLIVLSSIGSLTSVFAQEERPTPYFVTYDHRLEEKGTLEIANNSVPGHADGINPFLGNWSEFEYGATDWWTTELYVDWQHTRHDSSVFTGFRFENRFRPWELSHWFTPVFYVEYEHLNAADKILKEIVGFDGKDGLAASNHDLKHEKEHEFETKVIFSTDIGLWNISENLIGVRNVHEGPWEFGYAVGVSRQLAESNGHDCIFCAERFAAGVEMYGGVGDWGNITLSGTSHYIAPVVIWALPTDTYISFSPGWGLTDNSVGTLFRIGVSQDIDGFGHQLKNLFRRD